MEKNIDLIALRFHWPPGSLGCLTIERAARLFATVDEEITRENSDSQDG